MFSAETSSASSSVVKNLCVYRVRSQLFSLRDHDGDGGDDSFDSSSAGCDGNFFSFEMSLSEVVLYLQNVRS